MYWASLGRTLDQALEHGRLWTSPRKGDKVPAHRGLIKELEPGDLVFGYARSEVRALFRVSASWVDAQRPPEHPNPNGDPDGGWLVRVETEASDLHLRYEAAAEVIGRGTGTPFDKNGRQAEGQYLTSLSDAHGRALLALLGQDGLVTPEEDSFRGLPTHVWEGVTDGDAFGKARLEQRELRKALLGGRSIAACALCGREFQSKLLVAAHIVPRRHLDNDQRGRLSEVAMLACAMGCDAAFEWSYITVGATGRIESGRPTGTADLRALVAGLIGRTCSAFNDSTAAAFARHAEMALVQPRDSCGFGLGANATPP
jgi:hypothetical protein